MKHSLPGPVPTLRELRKSTPWVRLVSNNSHCRHTVPVALVPVMIRLGSDTSSNVLRRSAKCSKCGQVGAATFAPSYVSTVVGFEPFPIELKEGASAGEAEA